ncbi:YggS family pyridoxal phosphate-dependent enzyme [archaeon]|jgi:PLP dependent protein|nr:YggS family pyridoxal phosphate-dependent enzyme [archaeon]MBT7128434.1 YggS family pyridoxal phosphate-dependent enzyme [archaeon]
MVSKILDNLTRIKQSIGSEVILVAVTKRRSVAEINELIGFGVGDIGENQVGEALGKFGEFDGKVKKHFIGTIQSNKVRSIVENFDLIQSVDRLKVARLIDRFAGEVGKVMPVLVQVNISLEESKSGVLPGEVEDFISEISVLKNVRVIGLMCIGSRGRRDEFGKMKVLFDELREKGFSMKILSMGMSGDFEMAIEEGSNMVRVGSRIFEDG